MDDINRKWLERVAQAKPGQDLPDNLFGELDGMKCGWGPAMSAMAQAALDVIDDQVRSFELRNRALAGAHPSGATWRPI